MPSRISGACTPCRSKKQKCSGHHPVCSQCANAAIDCTWPEQRKRGPAKGYIEALESRLHSAESLLLAMLPLVSDNTVERASNSLRHDDEDDPEGSGGRRSSPPLLNKKTGLDYWDSFPLDTRRNIRKWQFDCEANSNHSTQYTHSRENSNAAGRRNRSPAHSHSPASVGVVSPRGSMSAVPQPNNWMQPMQPYVPHPQMQTGAAHQLMNLSAQRRDPWMTQQNPGPMQLDPNLMQTRSLPQQNSHVYGGNGQQNLFW